MWPAWRPQPNLKRRMLRRDEEEIAGERIYSDMMITRPVNRSASLRGSAPGQERCWWVENKHNLFRQLLPNQRRWPAGVRLALHSAWLWQELRLSVDGTKAMITLNNEHP